MPGKVQPAASADAGLTVAFRVVVRHPERMKRPTTDVDYTFTRSVGAVCLHPVVSTGPTDIHVSLQPSSDHNKRDSVAFALAADESNVERLVAWDRHPDVIFASRLIADTADASMSETWSAAISALTASHAWFDSPRSLELDLHVDDHKALHGCLLEMEKSGVAVQSTPDNKRVSWKFTESGAASIGCSLRLVHPRSVLQPRDGIDVLHMTMHELLCHLRASGWTPEATSTRKGHKPIELSLTGKVEKTLLMHASDDLPCKGYLLALAHTSDLSRAGVQDQGCVRHVSSDVAF